MDTASVFSHAHFNIVNAFMYLTQLYENASGTYSDILVYLVGKQTVSYNPVPVDHRSDPQMDCQ